MNIYHAKINSKELKELSVLQSWKSVAAIAFNWLLIVAAIAASEYFGGFLAWLAAAAIVAGRMHGFGVLMHDGSHYRIFKNKKLNDWVTDLLVAWPILSTTEGYRQNHLAHHQHTNTDKDPDWIAKLGDGAFTFPQAVARLVLQLAGYLVAVSSARDFWRILRRIGNNNSTGAYKAIRFGYYLGFAVLFTAFGIWTKFLIYWVVPYFTIFFLFLYVRSVAEHFGSMNYDDELGSTRTVLPYWWERLFFAPHNVNFHLEHHLYPGVPFYNLPKLHALLMRDEAYRARAHLTRGYSTGLVRECLAPGQGRIEVPVAAEGR